MYVIKEKKVARVWFGISLQGKVFVELGHLEYPRAQEEQGTWTQVKTFSLQETMRRQKNKHPPSEGKPWV